MQTEIEAKFLKVDHAQMRQRLKKIGAVCDQPMRLMRRKHYDFPDLRFQKLHGFVRLRDEGGKITLCYKQVDDLTVLGTKEINLEVSNFDAADRFLRTLGLQAKSYHETRRESWRLGNVQIELDEWPWLAPLLEIEAPDEKALWAITEKLGLKRTSAAHGSADFLYAAEYDVTTDEVNLWPEIIFSAKPAGLRPRKTSGTIKT